MLFIQFLLNLLVIKQSVDLIESQFEHFINKYDKPYKTDPEEYNKRMQNFQVKYNLSLFHIIIIVFNRIHLSRSII